MIFVLAAFTLGEGDTDAHWVDGSLNIEQLDLTGYNGKFPDVPEGYAQPLHASRKFSFPSTADAKCFPETSHTKKDFSRSDS